MKIEDQVCSLELAKKLRELGVSQNSLWYWVKDGDEDVVITGEKLILAGGLPTNSNVFSAFTVAELGESLKASSVDLPRWRRDRWTWTKYDAYPESAMPTAFLSSLTEANARAMQLAYLVEPKGRNRCENKQIGE